MLLLIFFFLKQNFDHFTCVIFVAFFSHKMYHGYLFMSEHEDLKYSSIMSQIFHIDWYLCSQCLIKMGYTVEIDICIHIPFKMYGAISVDMF